MKRFLILGALVCLCLSAAAADKADRWVSVKSAVLKSGTGWVSAKTAVLSYGDKLQVLAEKGKWLQVCLSADTSKKGWVTKSSVTTKKVVASGSAAVNADAKEISLAGKGFTAEIENEYKKNASIDYNAVDAVETLAVADDAEQQFIKDGGLQGGE